MSVRGVWQLKKVTLQYCKHSGSSGGVRDYLRQGLVDFAHANPQLEVHTRVRPGRHPVAVGEYVRGSTKTHTLRNADPARVEHLLADLRNSSGRKMTKFGFIVKTDTPSVQGGWRPDLPAPLDSEMVHFVDDEVHGEGGGGRGDRIERLTNRVNALRVVLHWNEHNTFINDAGKMVRTKL